MSVEGIVKRERERKCGEMKEKMKELKEDGSLHE